MTADTLLLFASIPALMWLALALAPWRPWGTREALDADSLAQNNPSDGNLDDVTAVIPARNEARHLRTTLPSVTRQGGRLRIILVDDGSTDGTTAAAREAGGDHLEIVAGEPLPQGWGGKLWALEQGRKRVVTPLTLLLDADIVLSPGIVGALRRKMFRERIPFLSLLAEPSFESLWERILMPAFVFFFKVLYPFRLANSPSSKTAAAAGGCILVETKLLEEIGGLGRIKDALIDDCALAREIKRSGHGTWIGLTHSARSVRPYGDLRNVWNMVARTAFTQLGYSAGMLLLCTAALVMAAWAPVVALAAGSPPARFVAAGALAIMALTYLPTLRFYGRSPLEASALPLAMTLLLGMTWTSALRYWKGDRSRWKGRVYDAKMGVKGAAAGRARR
jgi:hopene-associated glycosyltransferase HpnB